MLALDILRLVSGALQDLEPGKEKRWDWSGNAYDQIGMLDFMNAAILAVALQRPDICAVTEPIRLEPGMRQALPCRKRHSATKDARFLMELVRNMGKDGLCPGAGIFPVSMPLLLAWARAPKEGNSIENFAYDRALDPKSYLVYPSVPQCGEVWVEATYSAEPCKVCSPDDCFPLPDEYAEAVKHHMLASILSGDNEFGNSSFATLHEQLFSQAMGTKLSVDMAWPRARNSVAAG